RLILQSRSKWLPAPKHSAVFRPPDTQGGCAQRIIDGRRKRIGCQPRASLPDFKSGLYRDEIPRRVNVAAFYRIIDKSLDVEIAGRARVGKVGIGDVGGLTALVLLASVPHGIGRVADDCLPNPVAERPHITAAAQPDHELSAIGPAGGELFRVKPKII